jgi:cytochrome c-type biogenesis protein CcmH
MALKDRLARIEEMRAGRPGQAEAEARTPEVEVLPPGADARYLELVAQLRAKVAERGEDVTGHRLLARHEAALGRFRAARAAQARVVELLGEAAGAQDLADLADLMIVSAGNYVSPEAEAVLVRALQRDPLNGMARYYTGLLFAQTGRPDQALRMWRALVREGPADAPWIPAIRAQIAQVAQMAGELPDLPEPEAAAPAPALPGAPGPSAADVEAAAGLSEDERSAMIRGMVASLDARLAEDGGTLEEWLRLISAWGVLGDEAGRAAALTRAEAAFAADPAALERLRAAAAGAQ